MKFFKTPADLLAQGVIVALGSAFVSAPVMAEQASVSGAYVHTSQSGEVNSYSGEIVLPSGSIFTTTSPLTVGFTEGATPVGTTALEGTLTITPPASTTSSIPTGGLEEKVVAVLTALTTDATATKTNIDAVSAIIKASTGVDGLD